MNEPIVSSMYPPQQPQQQPVPYAYPVYASPPPTNTLAIIALVFGCLVFVTFGLSGLAALPMGLVAVTQVRKTGERGHGMAVAGAILGAFASVGWLITCGFFGIALIGSAHR